MFKKITLAIAAALMLASTATAQEPPRFAVSLNNGVVSPSLITVPANTLIVLTISNDGNSTAEFESKALHIERVLAAGMSVAIRLRNLAPGEYEFVDEFTEDLATAHGTIIAN